MADFQSSCQAQQTISLTGTETTQKPLQFSRIRRKRVAANVERRSEKRNRSFSPENHLRARILKPHKSASQLAISRHQQSSDLNDNGFSQLPTQVAALTKTAAFKQLISETTAQETENLLEILEKRLNAADNMVLFSLQEAENLILEPQAEGKPKPEYLMLTDEYLSKSRQKYRVQRLMQIAANKGVKTRVINAESTAGKRLTQLGGIVCLAKRE